MGNTASSLSSSSSLKWMLRKQLIRLGHILSKLRSPPRGLTRIKRTFLRKLRALKEKPPKPVEICEDTYTPYTTDNPLPRTSSQYTEEQALKENENCDSRFTALLRPSPKGRRVVKLQDLGYYKWKQRFEDGDLLPFTVQYEPSLMHDISTDVVSGQVTPSGFPSFTDKIKAKKPTLVKEVNVNANRHQVATRVPHLSGTISQIKVQSVRHKEMSQYAKVRQDLRKFQNIFDNLQNTHMKYYEH